MSESKYIKEELTSSDHYGSISEQSGDDHINVLRSKRSSSFGQSIRNSIVGIGSLTRDSIRNSLHYGGKQVSVRDLGGTSTISKSSFNLIKNLVGAGVLALPSGV